MITILIIMYMFLNYVLEMEKEELYKFMIVLSVVNIIPAVIYLLYTILFGGLNGIVLLLMAVI
jgi:hypothetical protein